MINTTAAKSYVNTIVIIPIGPGTLKKFVIDTIESFIFYNKETYRIILLDDSKEDVAFGIEFDYPNCEAIKTKKSLGGWAGLYISLCQAYSYAIEKYSFSVLLKLDSDALIIGPEPQKEILHLLSINPSIGIAGQYPNDYHGNQWNIKWPRQRIINGTKTWKFFRRPIANWHLKILYKRALQNGYITGESVFGGAYFISEQLLISLKQLGLLPKLSFRYLNLGEDHLFSLLAKALGFELVNLSARGFPFGCEWKGLPASPEKLIQDEKKIIHSVRYWDNLKEEEIRSFFEKERISPLL